MVSDFGVLLGEERGAGRAITFRIDFIFGSGTSGILITFPGMGNSLRFLILESSWIDLVCCSCCLSIKTVGSSTLLRTTTGAVSEDGRPLYSASPSSFVFLGIASGESPPSPSWEAVASPCSQASILLGYGFRSAPGGILIRREPGARAVFPHSPPL